MKSVIVIFTCIFITACGQNATQNSNQTNVVATSSPSPKPTVSKEEENKKYEITKSEQKAAVADFIVVNQKGWKIQGISTGGYSDECNEDTPCELHLTNGAQSKFVTIILKRFYKADGTDYWLVREARQMDLSKAKIEEIKETAIQNIDIVQVSDEMKDAIVEKYQEENSTDIDYSEPGPESYDPRN